MGDLLSLNFDNNEFMNFERCGDVIVSVQNNTCALFCKFCCDIFTNLLDFLRHLQHEHNDVLNFKVAHNVYSVEELLNTNFEEDVEEDAPVDSGALPPDIIEALQAYDVVCKTEENVKNTTAVEGKNELEFKMNQKPLLNSIKLTENIAKDNFMQLEKGPKSDAKQLALEVQTEVAEIANSLRNVEKLLKAEDLQRFNFDKENQSCADLMLLPSTSKAHTPKQGSFFGPSTNAKLPLSALKPSNRQPMAEYKQTDVIFGKQRPLPVSRSTELLRGELELTNDNKSSHKLKNVLHSVKRQTQAPPPPPPAGDVSCLPERVFRQRGHFFDFQQPKPMKTPKNQRCDSKSYAIQRTTHKKEMHRRMTQLKKRIFNSLNNDYKIPEKRSEKLQINDIEILPNLAPSTLAKLMKLPQVAEEPQQEETALANTEAAASASISLNTTAQEMPQAVSIKVKPNEIPKLERRQPSDNVKPTEAKLTVARTQSALGPSQAKAPSNANDTLKLLRDAHPTEAAANRVKSVERLTAKGPNANYITFTRPARVDNTIPQDKSKIKVEDEISPPVCVKRAHSPKGFHPAKCAKSDCIQLPTGATDQASASFSLDGMQLELSDSAVEFLHADLKSHKLNVDSILNSNLSMCSTAMAHDVADEGPYEEILEEVENELRAAGNTRPKSPIATAVDEEPAEVIISDDAHLLKTVGLQIIDEPDAEVYLIGDEQNVSSCKLAEKFSKLFKKYNNIWQTRYIIEQNVQRNICQQEFTHLMADLNVAFNVDFSISDVKRLVNMLTIWYSKQWDLKIIEKKSIPRSYEDFLILFSFMPKTMRRHYYCEYCEDQFYSESKYTSHRLLHTDARPFKCTLCPKSFNWEGHLRRHQRSHN